ncbi:MAG: DoxX family protein [Janthinobacterium lividum]
MSASTRNIIAWILQGLLALAFILSGAHKFMDLPKTVSGFTGMGLPAWFAYFIAGAEIAGGIGLLLPRLTRLAAAGLIIIMLGAVYVHATKIPGGIATGGPAIALLVLLIVVLVLRRPAPLATS